MAGKQIDEVISPGGNWGSSVTYIYLRWLPANYSLSDPDYTNFDVLTPQQVIYTEFLIQQVRNLTQLQITEVEHSLDVVTGIEVKGDITLGFADGNATYANADGWNTAVFEQYPTDTSLIGDVWLRQNDYAGKWGQSRIADLKSG